MKILVSAEFLEDGDHLGVGKRKWETARDKVRAFGSKGKPLTGPLQGCHRVTVGDWRCVYEMHEVEGEETALVLVLAHRSEVYEIAQARRTL